MSISTATIDQKYAAKGKCLMAELAIEAHTLVSNPGTVAAADAAGVAAIAALNAAGITGTVDPLVAQVTNGTAVNVTTSAGVAVPGVETANVAASVLTSVSLPATAAVVNQADANVVIQNSAGAAVTSAGVATVAAGVLSNVKLPATIAAVTNTVKVLAPAITGTWTNGYTFTVAAGVITAIVAS